MMAELRARWPRRSVKEYLALCWEHYRRNWRSYTLPVLAVLGLQTFVRLDFNITDSLPDQVFLTLKHWSGPIQKGDYVAFEWHGGGPFPKGIHFVKLIAGVPGDVVTMDAERNFWLNGAGGVVPGSGELLGWAKPRSRTGEALDPGPVGVIPPGYYYVRAPHPDSLDSRYALTGWIHESEIIGKSYGFTLFHK